VSELTEQQQQDDWLAGMNEDDTLVLTKPMLLEEKANPMRVLDLSCMAAQRR
jgi:hypothetical protein